MASNGTGRACLCNLRRLDRIRITSVLHACPATMDQQAAGMPIRDGCQQYGRDSMRWGQNGCMGFSPQVSRDVDRQHKASGALLSSHLQQRAAWRLREGRHSLCSALGHSAPLVSCYLSMASTPGGNGIAAGPDRRPATSASRGSGLQLGLRAWPIVTAWAAIRQLQAPEFLRPSRTAALAPSRRRCCHHHRRLLRPPSPSCSPPPPCSAAGGGRAGGAPGF